MAAKAKKRAKPAVRKVRQQDDAALVLVAAQTHALQLLSQDKPLEQVFNALLKPIEELSGGAMLTSILTIEEGKRVRHCAAPSLPREYIAAIDGSEIGAEEGSCGTAAFTKQAVDVKDISSDRRWRKYKDVALRFGLKACWSTPIIAASGEVLGTFAMYYREPRRPSAFDRQLIRAVTRTAVVAIERALRVRELMESRERMAALFQASPVGIFFTDTAGCGLFTNPSFREICGFGKEEGADFGWMRFIHPEDAARVKRDWATAIEKQVSYEGEVRWLRRSGGERSTVVRTAPVRLRNGKVIGHMGTIADRTERLAAERKALALSSELSAIFESSPMAMVYCDADDVVRTWNWTAEVLFGWRAKEVVGRKLPIASGHEQDWFSLRERVSRGRVVSNVPVLISCKKGEHANAYAYAAPVVKEEGRFAGIVLHLSPIGVERGAAATVSLRR